MTTTGSFLPGLAFDGSSVGVQLTTPDGRWWRDDFNKVEINGRLFVQTSGSAPNTAYATIPTTLPLCVDDGMDYALTISWRGIKLASGITAVRAWMNVNSNVIGLALDGNAKAFVPLTKAQFIDGETRFDFSGWYMAAP